MLLKCRTFFSFIAVFLVVLSPSFSASAVAYGSTASIAAAFGENGFFCAIDAGGKQEVVCWDRENKSSAISAYLPPMASLSGGEGFICGVTLNSSQAYCWSSSDPGRNLVPQAFTYNSYSKLAAGKNHVCGIRGLYYSGPEFGPVECWEYHRSGDGSGVLWNSSFHDPYIEKLLFKTAVSGDGFACGLVKDSSFVCWGPKSSNLGVSNTKSINFNLLVSSRSSVCGISSISGGVECFGDAREYGSAPDGFPFAALTAGSSHFCGIRGDNHEIDCWGSVNESSIPRSSGFLSIASSDYTTCGVREFDLVLDCWSVLGKSKPDYSPPLQLCSPGLCSPHPCNSNFFAFNASVLKEPQLRSLCNQNNLQICLPCGSNCSGGYFASSECNENADRVCTPCTLCQNSSCWEACGMPSKSQAKTHEQRELRKHLIIFGCAVLGSVMFISWLFLIPQMIRRKDEERSRMLCCFCLGNRVVEADPDVSPQTPVSTAISIGETQIFRLSELKDATHGFKEYNELGRGSFGFVYKAVLSDGRQVAVKRANAATIIHTNNREFETELEIFCKIRHDNIVNLLGYCAEMGERLLVYEYMPHGTLHDHLHGDLSPLDWSMRLKVALQTAKGLDYLHNEVEPPIIHRRVKSSNVLLDAGWVARIADFGLLTANDRDVSRSMEMDVYNFGIILLEILSGRKPYDLDFDPPEILEWAVPLIRKGKAAEIIDRNIALPRNFEPLLKLADLTELALRENVNERLKMRSLVSFLELIVSSGLTFS